ncbi:MAG: nitroreductase family protein, partial [Bacteroidales bacterium]|nr:nitroreductase family protein [Bacteroidales bacterium]
MTTIDLINNHRSIRKFQSRPIEEDKMQRILECGMRASNTGNMQIYSIVL